MGVITWVEFQTQEASIYKVSVRLGGERIRESDSDFDIFVTGGKVDSLKSQILNVEEVIKPWELWKSKSIAKTLEIDCRDQVGNYCLNQDL